MRAWAGAGGGLDSVGEMEVGSQVLTQPQALAAGWSSAVVLQLRVPAWMLGSGHRRGQRCLPGWHPGDVPGEGSLLQELCGRTARLVPSTRLAR